MRKVLFLVMFFAFLFVGCNKSVTYVCSDGSVVDDASKCPSPQETESLISPVEITPTDTYTLKKGESVTVEGKVVTLKEVFDDGRTIVDVSGVSREIASTKYLEIINGLEVTVIGISYEVTNRSLSSAVLKVNKLVLNESEYLFFNDRPQVIDGVEVTLKGVTPSYILVDTNEVLGMKIYPGQSKVISGLNITNVRAFPRGIRLEDYAILRIVKV